MAVDYAYGRRAQFLDSHAAGRQNLCDVPDAPTRSSPTRRAAALPLRGREKTKTSGLHGSIVRVLIMNLNRGHDIGFHAAHDVAFDPDMLSLLLAVQRFSIKEDFDFEAFQRTAFPIHGGEPQVVRIRF